MYIDKKRKRESYIYMFVRNRGPNLNIMNNGICELISHSSRGSQYSLHTIAFGKSMNTILL